MFHFFGNIYKVTITYQVRVNSERNILIFSDLCMDNRKNIVKSEILNDNVIKNDSGYSVKCFICNNYRILKTRENVRRALKYNRNCNSCTRSIIQTGKNLGERCKLSMSLSQKRRYANVEERKKTSYSVKKAMHVPEIRKKHIQALTKSRWLGMSVDLGQIDFINKWNRLGFHFEPNYQIHTENFLCYLDGYDKEKNVVLEYDSLYHSKNNQKQKDLVRQQKIVEILKPKRFWRYNLKSKSIKNVLHFQ